MDKKELIEKIINIIDEYNKPLHLKTMNELIKENEAILGEMATRHGVDI